MSEIKRTIQASEIRDWAIAAVPAIYILGFVIWALHSLYHGLGLLPLTIPHYVASGLAAVAMIISGVALETAFYRHAPKWLFKTESGGMRGRLRFMIIRLLAKVAFAVVVFAFYTYVPASMGFLHFDVKALGRAIIGLALLLGFVDAISLGPFVYDAEEAQPAAIRRQWLIELLGTFSLKRLLLKSASWSIIVVIIMALVLLPGLEPELGGAKSRDAILELNPQDLSIETRFALFSNVAVLDPNVSLLRTDTLTVLFAGPESLLVRHSERAHGNDALYEIPRHTINAIIWEN